MANGVHRHGRKGYGNSHDRRRRREYLIKKYGSPTGKTIKCHHCPRRMRTSTPKRPSGTFHVDRFPKCGHLGGTYKRANIVPACPSCNTKRCNPRTRRCTVRRHLA